MGHSQGTSQMFTALTYNFGDMRNKVNAFVALAPVINLGHSTNSIIQQAGTKREAVIDKMVKNNVYEIGGSTMDALTGGACLYFNCDLFKSFSTPKYNRPDRVEVSSKRPSSYASVKQIMHYA